MDFSIKTGIPEKQKADCLVLAVFESGKLADSTAAIDKACGGVISKIVKQGDISGKVGQTLVLFNLANITSPRVLLVGCGKIESFSDKTYREVMLKVASTLGSLNISDAICFITELLVPDFDISWKAQQAVIAFNIVLYKFDEYKSKKDTTNKNELKQVGFWIAHKREADKAESGLNTGVSINAGLTLTKDLANTPANICTPSYLAKAAQKLAKEYKSVSAAILDEKELKSLKMGALIAVGQGSENKPKLITLEYRGTVKTEAPYVFVGKGITFDTGGNSLKSPTNMIGMKYDMSGGATVLGLIKFAAELRLPLNLVGVIAAAENMPGGQASRPDDIITTMAGLTVEILNTDAEGRLVLADALTYCKRFKPRVVIDLATLTGACVVALGNHHSGLYTNYQPLANELITAGLISGDKCWQMPLTDEYKKQLDSNVADMANVGGPEAGSITAACFLSRFTEDYHWAHLDIAGTACKFTGKDRGATGAPLPMLAEYLLNNAK